MLTQHRTRVPLVTWSDAAVARVTRAWYEVQFRQTCDRVLYMSSAYQWGITSQMRDYGDLLIVSALTFNRTLILVDDAPRPKWCAEDAWLECFFEPLSTKKCAKTLNDLQGISVVKAWPDVVNGTEDIPLALSADDSSLQLVSSARFVNVVNDTSYFPGALWREMLRDGVVMVHESDGTKIPNMDAFCLGQPYRKHLCHTLALSALRTMLSGIVFRPKPDIVTATTARVRQLCLRERPSRQHCLAVHLRWTDKAADGGQAFLLTNQTMVARVHHALDRAERRTGLAYRCLLVISDDDGAAVRSLRRSVGDTYDVLPLSNVSSMFSSSPAEYEAYQRQGHEYVQSALMSNAIEDMQRQQEQQQQQQQQQQQDQQQRPSANNERYYDYYKTVIVDVWTAVSTADYFVGVGTSGVSQLIAQLIGSRRRADGNAFALWQEDLAQK
jgi:hypothetical protein